MLFISYLGNVLYFIKVNFVHLIFDFWNQLQFIMWEVVGNTFLFY
jgi:hypothetical protein